LTFILSPCSNYKTHPYKYYSRTDSLSAPVKQMNKNNFLKKYVLMAIEFIIFSRWSWTALLDTITKYCMDLFIYPRTPHT